MKSFAAACVATVLIAVGAYVALDEAGFSAAEQMSHSETVRLD